MMDASKLKDWAEAQGHTVPLDPYFQEMLLCHERYFGRTHERGIDRQASKRQLDKLIERLQQPFPQQRGHEYPAIKELRAYVEHYQKMRYAESQRQLAKQQAEAREELKDLVQELEQDTPATFDEDEHMLEQKRSRSQSRSR